MLCLECWNLILFLHYFQGLPGEKGERGPPGNDIRGQRGPSGPPGNIVNVILLLSEQENQLTYSIIPRQRSTNQFKL